MSRRQGIFWLCTIPYADLTPYPLPGSSWFRGQLELGEGGFLHWQVFIAFTQKKSLRQLQELLGTRGHYELSRSESATTYVWKEDTRVPGTQFEFGAKPIRVNSAVDWEEVWSSAQEIDLMAIPASVRVRCYSTIIRIGKDFAVPIGMERTCSVFWGSTGTGKSRRAWDEAGLDCYSKDPRTKWWDGYRGQQHVVIDEFRGAIDISHLLRWLDRYPVRVETKGGAIPLSANKFWITSNLNPREWYSELDSDTLNALLRRLNIIHFDSL